MKISKRWWKKVMPPWKVYENLHKPRVQTKLRPTNSILPPDRHRHRPARYEQMKKKFHLSSPSPAFPPDRLNYTGRIVSGEHRESLVWATGCFLPNYFRISASYDRHPSAYISPRPRPCGYRGPHTCPCIHTSDLSPGYHIHGENGKTIMAGNGEMQPSENFYGCGTCAPLIPNPGVEHSARMKLKSL